MCIYMAPAPMAISLIFYASVYHVDVYVPNLHATALVCESHLYMLGSCDQWISCVF